MALLPSASEPKSDSAPPPAAPTSTSSSAKDDAVRFATMLSRIDLLLVLVVLALAFLMASFTIRNGDYWMHLASGKLIAHNEYSFGKDPFSHATEGRYWANHAWLFDVVLYGLHTLSANGMAAVIFKAVLVTMLVLFMFLACRPAKNDRIEPGSKADPLRWLAALFTAAALVAIAPRMNLQPVVVSFLFTGITFWLLNHDRDKPSVVRLAVPIGLLFALWVNCDEWFIVGPALVALTLVGEAIQCVVPGAETNRPSPARLKMLSIALGVGLIACLLSPHHIHSFALPADFNDLRLAASYTGDQAFKMQFYHSYDDSFYKNSNFGNNQAGYCALALLVAGILAFVLNVANLRWGLGLPWIGMAALAVARWRLIPFFAIVAVPVTIQSLHAWFAARANRFDEADSAAAPAAADGGGFTVTLSGLAAFGGLMGRLFTLGLGVVALGLSYAGWLHVTNLNPLSDRHLAWSAEPNEAFRDVAEQFPKWRTANLLPKETRVFCYHPDVANYLPWFAPGERGFFDYRYAVTAGLSNDFMRVRKGMAEAAAQPDLADNEWANVLEKHKITHVVLSGMNRSETMKRLAIWMLSDRSKWTVWFMNGQAAVFAWRLPPISTLEPLPQAFGAEAKRLPAPKSPGIPNPASFEEVPRKREMLDRYLYPPPIPSHDTEVIDNYLMMYLMASGQANFHELRGNERQKAVGVASEICLAPVGYSPLTVLNPVQFYMRGQELNKEMAEDHTRVTALALLTVRESWRAILSRPDQAFPYLRLAQAYDFLPPVGRELREIQLSRLRHQGLARLTVEQVEFLGLQELVTETYLALLNQYYFLRNPNERFYDIAAECLVQILKDFKKNPPRMIPPEQVDRVEESLRKELTRIQDVELPKRKERFILDSEKRPVGEQAFIAWKLGLLREAVKALEGGKLDLDMSIPMLVQFYISLGQGEQALYTVGEAAQLIELERDEKKREHLVRQYQQWRIRALISAGRFAEAGAELDASYANFEQKRDSMNTRVNIAISACGMALSDPVGTNPLVRNNTFISLMMTGSLSQPQSMMEDVTEFHAMRGMLALEEGDTATALKHLSAAVEPQGSPAIPFVGRADAMRYLEILKQQAAGKKK